MFLTRLPLPHSGSSTRNSSSDEARDAYLADAETMLLDSGYVMPLYNETYTWLLRDTLTGLQTDGMGVYYFQNVVKAAS